MSSLGKDLAYSLRTLVKQPGFAAIAILTLALGIGANTTIFSVVHAVLLKPLPYHEPDRLVWLWDTNVEADILTEPASVPNYVDWKAQNSSFADMAAFGRWSPVLTGAGGDAESLPGGYATPNLFELLGSRPMLGRTFAPNEGVTGGERVVMLSHGLWQRRFGGDRGIVGKPITLNGLSRTVVGVMPPDYRHLDMDGAVPSQLWIPVVFDPEGRGRRSDFLSVVARMKPGVTLDQAQADMSLIAARLAEEYPAANEGWSIDVIALKDRFTGEVRTTLLVLLAAVGFLLLIACANVASLQMTRATGRTKEVAIRSALGAGRWRLVRQFLVESAVIAVIGGAAGVFLAFWGIDALMTLRPDELPLMNTIAVNGPVLAFTLGLSVLTGLLFGLLPALQATTSDVRTAIQEGGRGGGSGGLAGRRTRSWLVVAEVALALVMLVGAGLMVRSLHQLIQIDPGIDADGLLTASVSLPNQGYEEGHQVTAFFQELLGNLENSPGVLAAAVSTDLPLTGGNNFLAFGVEGRPDSGDAPMMDAIVSTVSPGYFELMGIPLVRGRTLEGSDRADVVAVAVINDVTARQHWREENPVGSRFTFAGPDGPWIEIVGIVESVRDEGLDIDPYPQIYLPLAQAPRSGLSVIVRGSGEPLAQVGALRDSVRRIDPDIPVTRISSMDGLVAASLAQRRFSMILLSIFAGVALLLAAVGIYGVISYSVSQRVHEIGVRMALGAERRDVRRMVVRTGVQLAAVGVLIGLVASFGLTRMMSSIVFGVSTSDPLTFAAIAAVLGGVAVLASYLPARRATRVDPIVALRYE